MSGKVSCGTHNHSASVLLELAVLISLVPSCACCLPCCVCVCAQSASDAASEALAARLQAEQDAALAQQLEDERLAMAHDPWQQAEQEWDTAMKQVGKEKDTVGCTLPSWLSANRQRTQLPSLCEYVSSMTLRPARKQPERSPRGECSCTCLQPPGCSAHCAVR